MARLTRELERARAEAERLRDRLQTVVDEQVSPHETLPAEELITLLEHSLAEGRHERERLRGALELLRDSVSEFKAFSSEGLEPALVRSGLYDALAQANAALAGEEGDYE